MPFNLGFSELLLIFLVILLLFGAKRLPELAQGLGKGIREFKRAMKDTGEEINGPVVDHRVPPPPAPPAQLPPRPDDHK